MTLLVGCGDGPNPETLVDELRIVAAVAEPPEVAPGASFALTVTVARSDDADLLVWTCGDTCVQARPQLVDEQATVEFLATTDPIWMLACEGCDLEVGEARLRDPVGWLEDLPLEGVAAASRTVRVSDTPEARNPVIERAPEPDTLVGANPEAPTPLRFRVPGAETAFGSATDGGFGRPQFDIASDGTAVLEWYGPEDAGRVYVVFEGIDGASAVWIGDARP